MVNVPHYFIAIPLPQHIKAFFSHYQQKLKKQLSYKVWPVAEDFHITLKFLGAVNENKLQQLIKKLHSIEQVNRFTITVGTIGTFGNPSAPRVFFADVEKTKDLLLLHKEVENCALQAGFSVEKRPYRPHITLAKKWKGHNVSTELLENLKRQYDETKKIEVTKVVLFQIFPTKTPKYEEVQSYYLTT